MGAAGIRLNLPPAKAFPPPNSIPKLMPMPRYFFNIRDGYDVNEDEEGIEFPDLEAARAEALATVEELRDELADAGNIELEITDETGRRLLTVPFFRGAHGGRRR
jgi:hypothetical protein